MKQIFGKKEKYCRLMAVACLVICMLATAFPQPIPAAVKTTADNTNGRYLYYSNLCCNTIYRLDTVSGKNKIIKTIDKISGVADISYYKGYLYFSANFYTEGDDNAWWYICRMKADGTKFKKLACGSNPMIYNQKIYYAKERREKDKYGEYGTVLEGISVMSLTGKNMKKLIKDAYLTGVINGRLYYYNNGFLYQATLKGRNQKRIWALNTSWSYIDGKYLYFSSNGTTYRLNGSTEKKTKITGVPSDGRIVSVRKGDIYYVVDGAEKNILKVYKTASKKTISIWSNRWIHNYYTGKGKYGIVDCGVEGATGFDSYGMNNHFVRLTVTGKKQKIVGRYYVS